ncbi:MAG: MurR/RpiR family transcriptional regulator [Cetobacterium sp.]
MIDLNYISKKHKLTKLEKNILDFIISNIQDKRKVSIRNVAFENFTSTSVIYKCIKKIGYSSYSNFIYSLNNDKISLFSKDYIFQENESFKKAIQLLISNKQKLFMFVTIGIANNISSYMNEKLALLGIRSICNAHIQLLDKNFSKEIILICISESGETDSLVDIFKIAKKNKIETISFLGKKNSTIENLSSVSIILPENIFFADVIIVFENMLKQL